LYFTRWAFNIADIEPQTPPIVLTSVNYKQCTDEVNVKFSLLLQGKSQNWVHRSGAIADISKLMGVTRSTNFLIIGLCGKSSCQWLKYFAGRPFTKSARGEKPMYDTTENGAHVLAIGRQKANPSATLMKVPYAHQQKGLQYGRYGTANSPSYPSSR
jgi:hypothetical protein